MDFQVFYKKLGLRIKALREQRHLTQEKLAKALEISMEELFKTL